MSVSVIFNDGHIKAYCADVESVFRPFPAKDTVLNAAKNESFTLKTAKSGKTAFQIILLSDSDIVVENVEANGVFCFATNGVDIYGNDFKRTMPIEAGKAWPLWCLLDAENLNNTVLPIVIVLEGGQKLFLNIGIDKSDEYNTSLEDMHTLSRIEWLNSREGTENTVTGGLEPLTTEGNVIKIAGRDIKISASGAIESIGTYFKGNNSYFGDAAREILASPISYAVYENGKELEFVTSQFSLNHIDDTKAVWQAVNTCDGLKLIINGTAEYDGSISYKALIENGSGRNLSVRLCHTPTNEFSKYFIGLGKRGGNVPESFTWKWDNNKRQDAFWCGSVNGGVYICPTAEDITKPFVNIYFHHSRNFMPECWVNGGKGYFELVNDNGINMFYDSGEFICGDTANFAAEILITPFKKVDLNRHWSTHFYHKNYNVEYSKKDIDDAVSVGCTHINLHHGNDTLPYLNYPMQDVGAIKVLADMAHQNGLKLKPYYTVRELTTRLPELFVLRSLRQEIFPAPTYSQGGVSWQNGVDEYLTEVFGEEAIPAWKHTFEGGKYDGTTDPSVIVNPNSRMANFYIGSLAWFIQKTGIDGLYIDDVGYGKDVMRRVRRVFDKYNPESKIDFHTWDHFEDDFGAGWGHNALIYMGLFPYIDSLWVGECFDYDNNSAEFLLTEVSGIPFGLMGEMLEGDCNVWRGMLYGMTSRYPYYKCYTGPSPVPVWEMRKPFHNAEMIGFWEETQPIFADNDSVRCTVYKNADGKMLCCFANFGEGDATFKLCGDVTAKRIYAPYMADIQEEKQFTAEDTITVTEKGGIMLIIE